jgi:uncharacterized protein (TIGR02231 family)
MTDLIAPITDVTVYADRALIARKGRITLEAGEHELRINNLPLFLRDSLRASGRGPQGIRIMNVDITTAFYSRPPEAELVQLRTNIEELQQQEQLLKARQEALQERRHWLHSLGEQSKDFARGLAQGQMKPQDCADFFSFMSDQSAKDAEAALKLNKQIQQLHAEIEARLREFHQKQGNENPDRLAALVSLELANAGELELEISYIVLNASWQPQYDVRVQMDEAQSRGTVELLYSGMVQQATGERWENVNLALSTARPSLAAILPELKPWYLNIYTPPQPVPPIMPVAAAAPMAQMAFSRAKRTSPDNDVTYTAGVTDEEQAQSGPMEAEMVTASVEQTGTALLFRVNRSVDIPSDNSPHKTTIASDHLPCTFDYVSAPIIEENAHLRATITNTTPRVYLSGEANIFLGGEYVGTTRMKMRAPNERFKIFLGIDDSVKIKREPVERAVDKGNLLQNDLRRSTYAYRITIHNYASAARKVVVRDRLPVPQHERIKVKVQSLAPQPTEHTKLDILTWEFTLPADGEQVVEYRFVVEHPQGLKIIGLP